MSEIPTTPYDPNQLSRLAGHVQEHGPVVNSPIEAADPRNFPETPSEGDVATGGLFKSLGQHFSREGRIYRANHRVDVIARAGELITDPRGPVGDDPIAHAKKKTGWEGVYLREQKTGSRPREDDDFTDLGKRLLYKQGKPQDDLPEFGPNPYRPVTWTEKFAAKRLGWLTDRRRAKERDAAWIRKSYPAEDGDNARLSNRERRRQNSMNRQVRRSERKAAKLQRKFDKIANNENMMFAVSRHNQKRRTKGRPEPQQQASGTVDPTLRYSAQPFTSTDGAFNVQTMLANLPKVQRRAPQPTTEAQPARRRPEPLAPVPVASHTAPQEDLDTVMRRLHRNLLGEDMAEPQEQGPESAESATVADFEQAYLTALDMLAGKYRKKEPNVKFDRMSVESFANSLLKHGVPPTMAGFIYRDFQTKGIIASEHVPGEGYRVRATKDELEEISRSIRAALNNEPDA